MANHLKNFRDYDEHDVVNLLAYDGTAADNGLLVKVVSSNAGWKNTDELGLTETAGNSYGNAVSQRYNVKGLVTAAGSGDNVMGITLQQMAETDENGEKLVYNPRKAAEMGVVISGQAVPIATRGIFLYNGIQGTGTTDVSAGNKAYAGSNGLVSTLAGSTSENTQVGWFLGNADGNGDCLVRIAL
jgi:hypothetical protein